MEQVENITLLQAVNELLVAIKETPVATLDEVEQFSDAADALAIIRRHLQKQQAVGFSFNTETIELPLEASGTVPVPSDVISLRSTDPYVNYRLQDNKVYNADDRTYTFTEATTEVQVIRCAELDRCPLEIQEYVIAMAKREFVLAKRNSPALNQLTMEQVAQAKVAWMRWLTRDTRANINDGLKNQSILNKQSPTIIRNGSVRYA